VLEAAYAGVSADSVRAAEELFHAGQAAEARGCLELMLEVGGADSPLRAEILSDLAVIASVEQDFDGAAQLAAAALMENPEQQSALEVIEHCSTIREERAAAHSRDLQGARIAQYLALSTCVRVSGEPVLEQPLLLVGRGQVAFGRSVQFGWWRSPGFHDRYCYVEAAHHHTHIEVGDDTLFNNGVTLRAEGEGISIGADCLFGWDAQVFDSDFHDLHPRRRRSGTPTTKHVQIGNNVFIGANVIVTKGVTIGDDTVVGAGSLVVHSLPAGVIAAGSPARVLRRLDEA
jgi:maltose O-acetyltransferase